MGKALIFSIVLIFVFILGLGIFTIVKYNQKEVQITSIEHYGNIDEPLLLEGLIMEDSCFKLSPFEQFSDFKTTVSQVRGQSFNIEALEAYEDNDRIIQVCTSNLSSCDQKNSWLVVSINGYQVELPAEDLKRVTLSNGAIFNVVAWDVEGAGSGAPSDVCLW